MSTDIAKIIRELQKYCAATGQDPRLVCRRATDNPNLLDRLNRRAELTLHDAKRLRAYYKKNPPQTPGKA